jgi:hypothetical protein
MASIVLPTSSGSLELRSATGPHRCSTPTCGVRGGGLVEIHVHRGAGEEVDCIPVCGNCLASAIALQVRRQRLPARPESTP